MSKWIVIAGVGGVAYFLWRRSADKTMNWNQCDLGQKLKIISGEKGVSCGSPAYMGAGAASRMAPALQIPARGMAPSSGFGAVGAQVQSSVTNTLNSIVAKLQLGNIAKGAA